MLYESGKYDFWSDPISMGKWDIDIMSEPRRINQLLNVFPTLRDRLRSDEDVQEYISCFNKVHSGKAHTL
jgi:hypothetical protein